ncbi:hypothetical protein AB0L75_25485 [Streptomyces sp. NPDC052101]|uniref:hypothetical protein n=1 Tax=Streptomyces sp. NPDC052101 TaxID=3155763 RepID=UPI003448228B
MGLTPEQQTIVVEEAKQVAAMIQSKYTSLGQIGALALVVVTAVAGIAKTGGVGPIFLAAPPMLCIALATMTHFYADALALGVYLEKLQSALNEDLPGEVKLEYNKLLHRRRYLGLIPIQGTFLLLICAAYIAAGEIAYNLARHGGASQVFYWTSLVLGSACLILAAVDALRSERVAAQLIGIPIEQVAGSGGPLGLR